MIGAGTIINPILKVVTTVAILGAVYLFIVKPTLDTTENLANQTSNNVAKAISDSRVASAKSSMESYISNLENTWLAAAREVKSCRRDAGSNGDALVRCSEFAKDLVHQMQSDRNFALSYSNSLAAQGRGADAARVRDCVKEAGFKSGRLQRCRNLADKLLFG